MSLHSVRAGGADLQGAVHESVQGSEDKQCTNFVKLDTHEYAANGRGPSTSLLYHMFLSNMPHHSTLSC
jgi:hypothetical protein